MHHTRHGYKPFIKFTPVADRPLYIKTYLKVGGRYYAESDFTSFEALFSKWLMRAKFIVYDWVMGLLSPEIRMYYNTFFDEVLAGTNICKNKHFTIRIIASLMSGEMDTSLGNGLTNLLIHVFMFESERGIEIEIIVEGDDALLSWLGGGSDPPSAEDYAKLGLFVKLVFHENLSEAGFCGMIFDEEDMVNITDPLQLVTNLAWACSRYHDAKQSKLKALLRAKSLSYLYQYPRCPIVQSAALYGCRVTRGVDPTGYINSAHVDEWHRAQLLAALNKFGKGDVTPQVDLEIPSRTRDLMTKKYGITREEQMRIERIYDHKQDLEPIDLSFIKFPDSWVMFGATYTDDGKHVIDRTMWYRSRPIRCEARLAEVLEKLIDPSAIEVV